MLLVLDINAQEDIVLLKRTVATTNNDSVRLSAYTLLAKNYRPIDRNIAIKYIDTVQTSIALYQQKNKKLLRYHLLFKANSLTTLANIEIDKDNLDESIKINLQCVKIYEQLNNPRLIAVSLSNIGAIFIISGKLQDAIIYLKKSARFEAEMLKNEPDNVRLQIASAETFGNLGGVYSKTAQADSSILYYDKALQIYLKNKDNEGIAFCYNGLTTAYRLRKDFKTALDYANKALAIFKSSGNEREISQNYINFSDIYFDTKNFQKAVLYADSVEQVCIKNDLYENLMYIYETKMLAYEQLNDLKNQLKYFKKFINLKDSLNKANNTIEIEELKTQYETEKKEEEIVKLNKDNKIQELQLEKDAETKSRLTIIIISVVLVLLLLGILTVFLVRTISERKKAYLKLQEKNIEIQSQSAKLSEQAKLISRYQSQMNPHFIFNALNSIQGFVINNQKEKTIQQLQLFSTLMRETLNNSEKENISLDKEINYLKNYLTFEQEKFANKINFKLNIPDDLEELMMPPMMIQPFIENAIKHAGLQKIEEAEIGLEIRIENGLLKVKVSDNGKGIDLNAGALLKTSHALSIIRSRLDILFAAAKMEMKDEYFKITSVPDLQSGTEIEFYLPLIYKY
ncbi:MAG: tetratricopeptide repeat protein [Bacteroidia bacterium]|nr:tetratricopeptide repeat protein [Bacteroidia bacterium]